VIAVLQIDAVSVSLLEQLIAAGKLETLAALRARGRWLALETPATHFPAGSYASLYSGLSVSEHGMYYAFQWAPEQQRLRWRGTFPQPVMVWERLARAGKRALVVDPYECEPPDVADGLLLAGWQLENVMSLRTWSAPKSAAPELARVLGAPRSANEVFGKPSVRGLLDLRRRLLVAADRAADAAVHYLRRERFDLVWIDLLSGHLGGHQFWDLSQIEAEALDEATRSTLEHALEDLYVQMDRSLGRIVAELPEADLILTTPMSMDANMSRVDFLPGMLEAVLGSRRAETRAERFLWRLRGAVPTSARAKVANALHGPLTRELTMRLSSIGVDWSKTPVFMLPSDHFGQLRLNVRGREREGIVAPGDVDALVAELREGLLSFHDPDGEPAVVAVDRTTDLFEDGAFLDLLPDLIVRWSERSVAGVDVLTSPRFGDVPRPGAGSGRSGAHRPESWALLVPAAGTVVENGTPRVVDIVPTICAALGVAADDLPGRPLLAPR
jgi:predicted AlkP superfamily phosphohydrolase/phosphomutase